MQRSKSFYPWDSPDANLTETVNKQKPAESYGFLNACFIDPLIRTGISIPDLIYFYYFNNFLQKMSFFFNCLFSSNVHLQSYKYNEK